MLTLLHFLFIFCKAKIHDVSALPRNSSKTGKRQNFNIDQLLLVFLFLNMWKAAAVKIVYLLAVNGHVISDKLPSTNVDLRR